MKNKICSNVIMLSAGYGKRMLPLTEELPKPLIKVDGQALIDRSIMNLIDEGCDDFTINAHHRLGQMEQYISDLPQRFNSARFRISPESDHLLNTGGGAKNALAYMTGDPILISNSDAFWPRGSDQPIARMADAFTDAAEIVLLCAIPGRSSGFRRSHDFCLAPDKKVTNDRGMPVIYAGVALMSRVILENAPDGAFSLVDLFYRAQERGALHGVLLNTHWLHVGDPTAITEAEELLRRLQT